jgi:hypothetical protein
MRTFGLPSLLSVVLMFSGCGNVFIRANWNSVNQTVAGVISIVLSVMISSDNIVQLSVMISSDNIETQVTIVTLLDNMAASNVTFCGDQRTQFPPDRLAQATFTPGQPCATLVRVIIQN